jgi:hypothetical protein
LFLGALHVVGKFQAVCVRDVLPSWRSHARYETLGPEVPPLKAASALQPKGFAMAKGQQRSNREIRKPKKAVAAKSQPVMSSVAATFAKPQKPSGKR